MAHTPTTPTLCLSVGTRNFENGSLARVAIQSEKNVKTTPPPVKKDCCYHLESQWRTKVATVGNTFGSLDYSSSIYSSVTSGPPVVETTQSVHYYHHHPTCKNIENYTQEQFSTHIECTTTSNGSFAKFTTDKEAVNQLAVSNTCLQNPMKYDDSNPIASALTENLFSSENSSSESKIREKKIVEEVLTKGHHDSKEQDSLQEFEKNAANATINGKIGSIDTKLDRSIQKLDNLIQRGEKFSKSAALCRRNGLDPNLDELRGKEGKWKYLKHISSSDFRFPNIDKSTLVANKMEQIGKNSKEEIKGSSKNFYQVPLPSAEELISNYRKYLSEAQLKKYQYCSSRRNGLQDECYLSVPRAVVELKRNET